MRSPFPSSTGFSPLAAFALVFGACTPTADIGTRYCQDWPGADAAAAPVPTTPVSLPWSTGFEDGLCGYAAPMGFCYIAQAAAYSIVTSPVHSGRYAAAFQVQSDIDGGSQVRCVLQGGVPSSAYYGAWYYVPVAAQNNGNNWNLFHMGGGYPDGGLFHNLWDVSLSNTAAAGLHLTMFDFNRGGVTDAGVVPPIPIAQWFHIEVYFKHANDNTGELTLFQDGVALIDIAGPQPDNASSFQWFVGNWAANLVPASSTIYVDDVTVSATP